MANSIILNKELPTTNVKLNNGDVVLVKSTNSDEVCAFIVTSFRYSTRVTSQYDDNTSNYCSLINLKTGYIQFDERCSRNTTIKRVCNHLNESKNHLMVDESTFKLLKKDQFDINIITY